MKTIKHLFYLLLIPFLIISCERTYDAPPINVPKYDGTPNITIAELKAKYADTKVDSLINSTYILKAYIVGNDVSGNIYKQMYIQDHTGGIVISADIASNNTMYKVGQEIFIELQDLYICKYGGELQIGYSGTQANRISQVVFERHVHKNNWPDPSLVQPKTISLGALTDNMVNTLVQVEDIYFVNGGKNAFTTNNLATNEPIKDAAGKTLDVRTSQYANFSKEKLPYGTGKMVGILGRYNGAWQFVLRDKNDIIYFDGKDPVTPTPPTPTPTNIFNETFGTGNYDGKSPETKRLKIAEFTKFDMLAPIVYSDASGLADIRTIKGIDPHVWFPKGKDAYLTISNINTSAHSDIKLSFHLAADLYDKAASIDLNVIKLKCNGKELPLSSTPVSNANGDNNKYYTFEFNDIPSIENLVIEFISNASDNTTGIRLDNIKIISKSNDGSVVVNPDKK